MPASTLVDLHVHSSLSDGKLSPEAVAERLSARGVALAALTDHHTLAGQAGFRAALLRRGIGCISGVEISAWLDGREVHLLGLGVDAAHPELLAALAALGQAAGADLQSVEHAMQQRPACDASSSAVVEGRLCARAAIGLIHAAGGKAVWAHPLSGCWNLATTRAALPALTAAGLDGMEALYARYPQPQQQELLGLAEEHGLLVTAGSDFHDPAQDSDLLGVEMPQERWSRLRAALGRRIDGGELPPPRPRRRSLRRFVWHIAVPAVLALLLFVVGIFAFLLPHFESALLERKREMIRELASSAMTILEQSHQAQLRGELTLEQAQKQAAERIASLRYGREGKDYFWVQDMHPRMVVHPYRPDLNGQDVSEFRDARGARLFSEFAEVVRRRGEGYVDYVWQWKDDPSRLAPKESYVRGFAPWGWLIGTGLYTEDVHHEIARLERGLIYGSLIIVVTVSLLLLYVMHESFHLERERHDAELQLLAATHRYQSLVENSSEGAILLVDGRCRYANPMALRLLRREAQETQLLHLDDILPEGGINDVARRRLREPTGAPERPIEVELLTSEGERLPSLLAAIPVQVGDREATVLQVRPASRASAPRPIAVSSFAELLSQIRQAASADEVGSLARGVTAATTESLRQGVHARLLAREISGVCDAVTCRLVELSLQELPPPPARFCVLGMGSHGRAEQTLFTDQDNALIFADSDHNAAAWGVELGRRVCAGLDAAGYRFCRGEVMAQNPRWCAPLSVWKQHFRHWIAKSEPRELLDLSIFFDLRPVCGDAGLAADLAADTAAALRDSPAFFPHMAQNALEFKPPLRLFGRILAGTATGEHAGLVDLKDAMLPIVSFARLYALRHGIAATSTFERLAALAEGGLLARSTCEDVVFAAEHLLRLRLEHQAALAADGLPLDNAIDHRHLSHMQMLLLREAFSQIDVLQQKISSEFLGGQR
jgi:predicted metal-dependent phosphoesterase TrpH